MSDIIDTDTLDPQTTQAIALRDPNQALAPTAHGPKTPQELRVVEVSEALLPAYQKASTLEMTDAEIEALQAPFPDNAVEIRPHDGLIYIPHIHISDRLNKVFRPGKWSLMCRRHWLEGTTMYGEYILLVRGCYVGESIGGHPYQANNPKVNYSDTLESTAAEALRRIAGKRLSCGSQVWNPSYARDWVAKHAEKGRDGKWYRKQEQPQAQPQPVRQAPAPVAAPTQQPETKADPKAPTPATRTWMLEKLCGKDGEARDGVKSYFEAIGALRPEQDLDALPLEYVVISKPQLKTLMEAILAHTMGEVAVNPFKKEAK